MIHIYDISDKPVLKFAEKVEYATVENTHYDLIVCSNVLEHVPYPKDLVMNIKKCMSKDSILYIEVPLEDIVREAGMKKDTYKIKKHWHEHVNFYSESSIKEMMIQCGFRVKELKQLEATAGGHSSYLLQLACHI
ncbi:class I SAM-dependent methyltransferase [Aliarcobacter sp. ERUVET-8]|uniref:class I SAM-dependent methyltransferase n=1 Tax=Aliarcobacter sp. ERUVET-8 TaxID=3429684 RepID=UPI003D6B3145